MNEQERLAEEFGTHRAHLKKVALRMLGSSGEADDAVQESWLRVSRAGANDVDNLGGWLTTIVARVCLDMLRARKSRRETPLDLLTREPEVSDTNPEQQALLADSVGSAFLMVLEILTPAERVAYVLHEMFDLSFGEIAPIVSRSTEAARQLASRARRRPRGAGAVPTSSVNGQRRVVDAFLAASRNGDFEALVALLDPDVVLRADRVVSNGSARVLRGISTVAKGALLSTTRAAATRPMLVNGSIGLVWLPDGEPVVVLKFSIEKGKIVEIDIIGVPERLHALELAEIEGPLIPR